MTEPVSGGSADTPSPSSSNFIAIGALSINIPAWRVSVGDRLLTVTPLEFVVLLHFARNAGRVVTHDELLREVWQCPPEMGGTKNQVTCCVKRLRRNLRVNPQDLPYILTVRGRGYRMLTDAEWNASASAKSP